VELKFFYDSQQNKVSFVAKEKEGQFLPKRIALSLQLSDLSDSNTISPPPSVMIVDGGVRRRSDDCHSTWNENDGVE
jgi:hypothetical protein